jgi:HAD superfamily hydrolase (TIGR01509 family)
MPEAVIFDMDGVISKTSRFHTEAKKKQLEKYGISLGKDEIEERFAGVSSEILFRKVFEEHGVEEDHRKAAEEKREIYRELLEGEIEAVEGVIELIKELKDRYTLALASSSTEQNIEKVLDALDLNEKFQATVSAKEEGVKSKPDPSIYIEAAERIAVEPDNCVAIEDGRKGMKSVREAGMAVVAYVDDTDKKFPADLKISDMRSLDAGKLEKIS